MQNYKSVQHQSTFQKWFATLTPEGITSSYDRDECKVITQFRTISVPLPYQEYPLLAMLYANHKAYQEFISSNTEIMMDWPPLPVMKEHLLSKLKELAPPYVNETRILNALPKNIREIETPQVLKGITLEKWEGTTPVEDIPSSKIHVSDLLVADVPITSPPMLGSPTVKSNAIKISEPPINDALPSEPSESLVDTNISNELSDTNISNELLNTNDTMIIDDENKSRIDNNPGPADIIETQNPSYTLTKIMTEISDENILKNKYNGIGSPIITFKCSKFFNREEHIKILTIIKLMWVMKNVITISATRNQVQDEGSTKSISKDFEIFFKNVVSGYDITMTVLTENLIDSCLVHGIQAEPIDVNDFIDVLENGLQSGNKGGEFLGIISTLFKDIRKLILRLDLQQPAYYSDALNTLIDSIIEIPERLLILTSVVDRASKLLFSRLRPLFPTWPKYDTQEGVIPLEDGTTKIHLLCYKGDLKMKVSIDFESIPMLESSDIPDSLITIKCQVPYPPNETGNHTIDKENDRDIILSKIPQPYSSEASSKESSTSGKESEDKSIKENEAEDNLPRKEETHDTSHKRGRTPRAPKKNTKSENPSIKKLKPENVPTKGEKSPNSIPRRRKRKFIPDIDGTARRTRSHGTPSIIPEL